MRKKNRFRIVAPMLVLVGVMAALLHVSQRLEEDVPTDEGATTSSAAPSEDGSAEPAAHDTEEAVVMTPKALNEKYARPENGYLEISMSDPEGILDLAWIHTLKCYVAEPAYSSGEFVEKMAAYLWGDAEYSVSKQDFESLSAGSVVGWGDYYRCYEAESGESLEGSNLSIALSGSKEKRPIADEEAFLKELWGELRLGLWKDGENQLRMERTDEDGRYELAGTIDGCGISNEIDLGLAGADRDGIRYLPLSLPGAEFRESGGFDLMGLFSYEVKEEKALQKMYESPDEICKCMQQSLYNPNNDPEIFTVEPVEVVYVRGITETGQLVFAPWLMLKGTDAICTASSGWMVFDGMRAAVNLDTGDACHLSSEITEGDEE